MQKDERDAAALLWRLRFCRFAFYCWLVPDYLAGGAYL
jgi:hypothetical protein